MKDIEMEFIDYLEKHPIEKKKFDELVKIGSFDKSNDIIELVRKNPELSISQIGRILNITYVTALNFTNKLIKSGILQEFKPNPKIRLISLTKKQKESDKEYELLRKKMKKLFNVEGKIKIPPNLK